MSENALFENLPPVDKRDLLPRHVQVQQTLRSLVTSGRLSPGDKIPAELDIAAALGVSKMTVNKALLALTADGLFVREVGRGTFVATQAHNGIEKLVSPRIVLSFVDGARNVLDSDYYGTLYRGIIEYLTTQEKSIPLEVSLSSLSDENALPDDALGRLIIAPRYESFPVIARAWEQGQAIVIIGASWSRLAVPSVDSDNIGGAATAVQHLIDLGHRRIALLYAEEETANIQDRIVGYRRALMQSHIPHDPECEIAAGLAWEIGSEAERKIHSLLTGTNPITAIFAAGYYLALGAKNVIREADLRIPEDVSVVGYDDPVSAKLVYPPLTTIRQPLYEMGHRAAERLMRLIHEADTRNPIREILPAELIVRQSTARHP